MKLTKVAFAVAGLAATLATGIATAGNFQTQSTSVAREVIVGNAQQLVAPQVSYSFAGPVRNPAQTTYFQIQLTLSNGIWDTGTTTAGFPSNADNLNGGNVALVDAAGNVIATAWGVLLDSAHKNVLYATFQIPAGVGVNNARVVWNAAMNAALNTAATVPDPVNLLHIHQLKDLVGTVGSCDQAIMQLTGSVKQYPNITDPTYVATDAVDLSPASEHNVPGHQDTGPVLSFPVNLKVSGASVNVPVQDYNHQAKQFALGPGVTATGLTADLGTVTYTKPANGYDADLAHVYGSVATTVPGTAVSIGGSVELKDYAVTLTGNFSSAAKVWLSNGACVDGGYATGAAPSGGVVKATYNTAANLGVNSVLHVCYGVDGTAAIPTTGLPAVLVLEKASDTLGDVAARKQEQNNSCVASYSVGGGIQIDVRNYASYASYGKNGAATMVRIINNSETATADLFAQMIYADGKYGPWGAIGSLAPREVMNLSNQQLEAMLTTAAATSNPFGAASVYTNATGSAVVAGPKSGAGVGDRVRIVSTTGTTLRVQSYMVVGTTVLDVSGAQGVDFENIDPGRVPTTAIDAQPVSQDAIQGLAK